MLLTVHNLVDEGHINKFILQSRSKLLGYKRFTNSQYFNLLLQALKNEEFCNSRMQSALAKYQSSFFRGNFRNNKNPFLWNVLRASAAREKT
jgi:hypothetical protein